MIIGFFEAEEWEKKILEEKFPQDELLFYDKIISAEDLPDRKDIEVLAIFVGSRVTKEVIDALPNLRLVATRSTGFDHINLQACRTRNVAVTYVPGYGDNTVAEFAFGLLLNLTRKMYLAIDQLKETGSFALTGLRGTDLKGKTMGIIGTGRIGREAIRMAKGFGMEVVAYDPKPNPMAAGELGFRYVALEDLLAQSDAISLHCPLLPETTHLINKNNIKLVKKGAYLINTARGGLIETDALVSALRDGIIAGAGIDVLEEEGEMHEEMRILNQAHPKEEELKTILQNHILMRMPNVLITPHNAFNSDGAMNRILNTTIENIESFKKGAYTNLVPMPK